MTTINDPNDDEPIDNEEPADNEPDLDAEWRADRINHRLNVVRNARPERLRDSGPLDPRIADWGKALVTGSAGNLVIVGEVGRTKTWSAWEVLEQAVAASYAGTWHFSTAAEWQDAIAPPPDRDLLRRMRAVDLLILDDLGSSRINDWQLECMFGVIDERWQHNRPTIITSNVRKLGDTLGERLASRLRDGATSVALGGDDRRSGR